MNVYYIKNKKEKIYISDTNVEMNALSFVIKAEGQSIEDVKDMFANLENVTIYTAIQQEDGRETDEIVHQYFENFKKLTKVEYNLENDTYKVTIAEVTALENRVAELESMVQALLSK